ncbi:unnamed protein product [Heligmosomoides polygyrus]|uniref:CASP-like protein n=1 Tax=Heligmosomoides polygyrus TaxID=6339 RepID=A0A183G670_HELPZ|nr:unnamed protein product [Heligmosomoides polygyrus]
MEKRRETSRFAARDRRGKESEIFSDLRAVTLLRLCVFVFFALISSSSLTYAPSVVSMRGYSRYVVYRSWAIYVDDMRLDGLKWVL